MSAREWNGPVRDIPDSWPVDSSTERFRGGIVDVYTDRVRMSGPGGKAELVSRDRIVHSGSVAVVALDTAERVLLIRQYRHAASRRLWELPAGLRDHDGEAPQATAQRELLEEAGYRAEHWHTLVDCFPSPGISTERVRVFLARGLTRVPPESIGFERVHEEADLPQAWLSLPEAAAKALAGHLTNGIALQGILAAATAARDGFAGVRPADAPEG